MNVMSDSRRLLPGFVPMVGVSTPSSDSGPSPSRRASASAASLSNQQLLDPMNGRRRTSVAQSSLTPEMHQTGFPATPPYSQGRNLPSSQYLQSHQHQQYGGNGLQMPLTPPATPTKANGLISNDPTQTGRSPTSANFPDRRGSTTAIRMNSVVFDESPAQLSVINESSSFDSSMNSPDPGRRHSLAYEQFQSNATGKLIAVGNYGLRQVKSLSPTKLAFVTLVTLMIVYILLLITRVAIDTVNWAPPNTSRGDFRRAAQRAADFSKGVLGSQANGNQLNAAAAVEAANRRATAEQRARKAWGRGSRSKDEPLKPIRPIIPDQDLDEEDDDRLPPESDLSDEERDRRIGEAIARAGAKVRDPKAPKMIPRPGGGVQRVDAQMPPESEYLAAVRRKGPAREFGFKADLSRAKVRGENGQVVVERPVANGGGAAGSRAKKTTPKRIVPEPEAEEEEIESEQEGTVLEDDSDEGEAVDESEDVEAEEVDEIEYADDLPPAPKVKKVKPIGRKSPQQKLRKASRRPATQERPVARSGPAPIDSSQTSPPEIAKSAAQRLTEAKAQLAAAEEQLAAAAALQAAVAGRVGSDSAPQVPPPREMNAKIEQMQKMKMSREGKNRIRVPSRDPEGRAMDDHIFGKDSARAERNERKEREQRVGQPKRPLNMRKNKKGTPARQSTEGM